MAELTIEISEEVRRGLQSRATAGGFDSVEQYARATLVAAAEDGLDDAAVEQLLVERSKAGEPDVEFTTEWAQQFRRQVRLSRDRADSQHGGG